MGESEADSYRKKIEGGGGRTKTLPLLIARKRMFHIISSGVEANLVFKQGLLSRF